MIRVRLAIELSMRALHAIDHPETMTSPERLRLIFARDALVRTFTADEMRLYRLWADQQYPS